MSWRAAEYTYCARRLPIYATRSQLSASILSQRVRSYATSGSGGPNPDHDDSNKNQQTTPNNSGGSGGGGDNGNGEPPQGEKKQGESKLTKEEEQRIDELIEYMRPFTLKSEHHTLEAMRESMKEKGIPPELNDFLKDHFGPGKNPSVMDHVHLSRLLTRFFWDRSKNGPESAAWGDRSKEGERRRQGKQQGEGPKQTLNELLRFDTSNFIASALLAYLLYDSFVPHESGKEITWQEFRANFFDKGLVERLTVINGSHVRVELHRDAVGSVYPDSPASKPYFHYYFTIGSVDSFERHLDMAQAELSIPSAERIPVAYTEEVPWLATLLSFGPTLLLIGSFFWLSRRATGAAGSRNGIFGIGKSKARRFNHETDIKIKFSDIAGMDEAKVEIMEFVSYLKQPERFQRLGAKIPRGAILSGAPGTGKTLLAKATAGESGVPFFSVSGSEFVEMFVGVGPSRVRDLFANARKNTPCIIFIDEIDAIGKSRAKQNFGGGNDERESTLNQILTEMDGFNTSDQVVVLAGTNRPDVLDKALMRPGRFDRHISIDRPTMEGRKQIFGVYLTKIVTTEDLEYLTGRLAALTPGFAGADIANCVNEAALIGTFVTPYLFYFVSLLMCFVIAARENADRVVMRHFEMAIERVIGGLEKKSTVLSPDEKRTVAYHEAGHAICGWYFRWADPLLKVSIIPRGQGALGYAQYLPSNGGDTYLLNVRQLMDRMAMTLGGRVSEELHFDTVTSGASDDFRKVTAMASTMVTKFGMSPKIGYIFYQEDQNQIQKPFSEHTARDIDEEVRRIVNEAYKRCHALLTEKKKEIGLIAEELLTKEVIGREDMIRILGPRQWPDSEEFAKYFNGQVVAPPEPSEEGREGKDGRDQTPFPA